MSNVKPLPTQQELHELFDYSLVTGKLYWKVRKGRFLPGSEATAKEKWGYMTVRFDNVRYKQHRIIWCWVTGEDPGALDVEHKNEIKDCNAWHNLRLATGRQNAANRRKFKGYYKDKYGKYIVRVFKDRVACFYKRVATEAEAKALHRKASLELHGEFSGYYENQ